VKQVVKDSAESAYGSIMEKTEYNMLLDTFFAQQTHGLNDPELSIVETALFLEQTFDLVLSDEQIAGESIGTQDVASKLVNSMLGIH
jgi:hypothetical protein